MSSPSKAFWLDLLQHTIRVFALAMVSSVTVSAAGTAGGYLPVTQVDWLGGLYIGITAAVFTIVVSLTSIVIPGADPDTISWFPAPHSPAPVPPAPVPPAPSPPAPKSPSGLP